MTKQDVQIKSRFNLAVRKLSGVSTFIAYAEAIRGMGYNRGAVSKGFFNLVQKGDYLGSESEELCEWLQQQSQPA